MLDKDQLNQIEAQASEYQKNPLNCPLQLSKISTSSAGYLIHDNQVIVADEAGTDVMKWLIFLAEKQNTTIPSQFSSFMSLIVQGDVAIQKVATMAMAVMIPMDALIEDLADEMCDNECLMTKYHVPFDVLKTRIIQIEQAFGTL